MSRIALIEHFNKGQTSVPSATAERCLSIVRLSFGDRRPASSIHGDGRASEAPK